MRGDNVERRSGECMEGATSDMYTPNFTVHACTQCTHATRRVLQGKTLTNLEKQAKTRMGEGAG
jgi:hypothetical protein